MIIKVLALFLALHGIIGLVLKQAKADDKRGSHLIVHVTKIPGQTMKDRARSGAAIDILQAAAQKQGISTQYIFLPWARVLVEGEQAENALILPLSRNAAREDRFQWIASLYELSFGFVSLGTPVNALDNAARLPVIGVWRATIMEDFLQSKGFNNLMPLTDDSRMLQLLEKSRISAWYGSLNEARFRLQAQTTPAPQNIQFGTPIIQFPVWLAASLQTEPHLIRKLSQQIEQMKTSGDVDRILQSYSVNTQ